MGELPRSPAHPSAAGPDVMSLEDIGQQPSGGSEGGSPQDLADTADTVTSVPDSPPREEGEPSQPPMPPANSAAASSALDSSARDSSALDSSALDSSALDSSPSRNFSPVPLDTSDASPSDGAFIGPAAPPSVPPVESSVPGPEVEMAEEDEEVPPSPPTAARMPRSNGDGDSGSC